MIMNITDWIGFTGVTILLLAYFLNINNKLNKDGSTYILLNIIGAGIACLASVLLHYWPFIILEGAWTIVSLLSLYKFYQKK
jgi:hypothetical protein